MNIKSFLDEAVQRGGRFKSEVVSELLSSKALQDIVTNKKFVRAISTVIQTKDEVKRVIQTQVKNLFHAMDVPSKEELLNVAKKLGQMEKLVERIGRSKIAVRFLPHLSAKVAPRATAATSGVRRRTDSSRALRRVAVAAKGVGLGKKTAAKRK